MSKVTIYHNPRCSKSRAALQALKDKGIEPEIVEYLKTPPNESQISNLLQGLSMRPRDLIRKGEQEYKDNQLASKDLSDQDLIKSMAEHPKLIERPIVVVEKNGDTKMAIARPLENVLEIL
ncbi:MAG: arsenate reductase (glutaredoxin) [Gammaproteobacteria bacterium]|nr:arsenate reductase (glutaredoxin) [Gammaproteobacteria bacterium]